VYDSNAIKDFMINKVDLVIAGKISGLVGNLDDYSDEIISLTGGKAMGGVKEDHYDWNIIDSEEGNFVHIDGDNTKQGRILYRQFCFPKFYLIYPGQTWREYLANRLMEEFTGDQRWDGVFIDLTWAKPLDAPVTRWWRMIDNEPHFVENDGVTVNVDNAIHVDELYFECDARGVDIVKVTDVNGNELDVASYDATSITLNNSLALGTQVFAKYYSPVDIPQGIMDSWNRDLKETLTYLRNVLGGRLIINNGILATMQNVQDDHFAEYDNDGHMFEAFIHAPWGDGNVLPNENKWKARVDMLANVSKEKIFLAQSGTDANSVNEADMKELAMFVFSSFLLGKGDYAYFNFALGSDYKNFVYFDYWETNIGSPLEDYHLRESINGANIYEREFENVLVLVNPGEVSAVVELGLNYQLLDGTIVQTINLDAHQGIILYKI
jgi:hypothetical protein